MKLKLNSHIISDIVSLPLEEAGEKVKIFVNDLAKLYDLDNLSDEELKNIIREYYTFNIYNSDEELERVSKSILKTDTVARKVVDTNIRGPLWYSKVLQETIILYDAKMEVKDYYTLEELEKLVKERKIIVKDFYFSARRIEKDNDTAVLNTSLNPLSNIGDKDLGTYEDVILSKVRKRLQKTKVNRDIIRIINNMRTRLRIRQDKLIKEKVDLQNQIKLIEQSIIINCSEYQDCSSKLEELEELKR